MTDNYEYLGLLNRKLDNGQRDACCVQKNTIVSAGAGSGKTQVLATRFAWLVMTCNIPAGKILTLTFTKKAAAEMYSRIYETLRFFAENPNTPSAERQNAKIALEEFSEVHIQTLDSYCNSILKQAANRYGIKPDFTVSEDDIDISQEALSFVYENKDKACVKEFSKLGAYQEFAEEYFVKPTSKYTTIANYKGFFIDKISYQLEELVKIWQKYFLEAVSIADNIKKILPDFPPSNETIMLLSELTTARFPQREIDFLQNGDYTHPQILDYMEVVFTWAKELAGISKTRLRKEPAEILKAHQDEFRECNELLSLAFAQIKIFPVTQELMKLIENFSCQINEKKRKAGNLSIADVSKMALKILVEQKDIRDQEKRAYDKIMIDEFQDNNGENRDLLFLLSEKKDLLTDFPSPLKANTIKSLLKDYLEPNKLYFVGDEKQSIYKFRNADVSVFKELAEDLKTQPLPMINNYRSKIELLTTFNQIFGGFDVNDEKKYLSIFKDFSKNSFEANFSKSSIAQKVDKQSHERIKALPLDSSSVKTHFCMFDVQNAKQVGDDCLDVKDQLAYFIAKKIKEIYEKGNCSYSSFAILDKSRTERTYITKWLNRMGIPYNLDTQNKIFEEAPINDIYNYLKLCVYPSDTKAFASVLNSPFVNLSTKSTIEVIGLVKTFELRPEISAVLGENSKDYNKYIKAVKKFKENRRKFLSQSIATSVTDLWLSQSYYYETLLNTKVKLLAEQYDLLFELARTLDSQGKSLAWFIDELDTMRASQAAYIASEDAQINISEISYPLERDDAVQIMTIHKSKGLQFPITFVYGCTKPLKAPKESLFYYNQKIGFSIKPPYSKNCFFEINKAEEEERDVAEFNRLIYVAATRAEEELFIIGKWNPTSSNENNILLDLMKFYYSEESLAELEVERINSYEVIYKENAPFDFLSIEPQTNKLYYSKEFTSSERDNEKKYLEKIANKYHKAKIIQMPEIESNRKAPSQLETKGNEEDFLIPQIRELDGIDELMLKNLPKHEREKLLNFEDRENSIEEIENNILTTEYFNYADLGTLAHAFLFDFVNTGMNDDFSKADFTGGVKLFKNLDEKSEGKMTDYCIKMCHFFAASPLGQKVKDAIHQKRFVKAEWAFRMYKEKIFYTGSIDLIFQNSEGTYTLVDYKTDRKLNKEKYIGQQTCYKTAAASMLNIDEKKISSCLFYLRYAQQEWL